ncbi:MAG: acyl-CoA dehydrogenase, partial [candidate division Zixibacteria bacterium]|nr:acyl-CoA dehydrogenase [candidate division Zixibacteria bacterium]
MIEKKHEEYREKLRAFALEKIAPVANTLDHEQRFLTEHIGPM